VRGAGTLPQGISPLGEIHGTEGAPSMQQVSRAGGRTGAWGYGGTPCQDGDKAAAGGTGRCIWCSSEVSPLSIKRRRGGREGKGILMPCLTEVFLGGHLGYSSASRSWLCVVNANYSAVGVRFAPLQTNRAHLK